MKIALTLLGILLALAGVLFLLAHSHAASLERAARWGAYVHLQRAYLHYAAYGEITNSAPGLGRTFPFTNTVRIQGTDYPCILGIDWAHFRCAQGTVVAITADGRQAIWLEPGKPTRVVPMPSKP